jgi:hypothetical protein
VVAAGKDQGPIRVEELLAAEHWARPTGYALLALFAIGLLYSTRRVSFNNAWPLFLAASSIVVPISWEHTLLLALPVYALLAHAVYLAAQTRLELAYLVLLLLYASGSNSVGFIAVSNGVLPFWSNFLILLPQLSVLVTIFWYASIVSRRANPKAP